MVKKKSQKKSTKKSKKKKQSKEKVLTTLNLKQETDIAMDFATKTYKQFNKIVKSIILFGSVAKQHAEAGSDIDIVIVIDDVSIKWDQELIAWYRQELDKIIRKNPYQKDLHINTIKLSTWWEDILRGDPTLLNILRYGEPLIDFAGFFIPLKYLLITGKIKSTPEAIYSCLKRAPVHLGRSKQAELATVEGLYWSMVDSSHAALMTANVSPPSPEHIAIDLKDVFVSNKMLKPQYVEWFRDLLMLHKKIEHGQISDLKGVQIDLWQQRTEEFLQVMTELVRSQISEK